MKRIGLWVSDKKSQKFNWNELEDVFKYYGYELIKVDLDKPLENQGPFSVFIHKLTDILSVADQGNQNAKEIIKRVEQYLSNNPELPVVDPLDNVRILLNRTRYYTLVSQQSVFKKQSICTPPFVELTSTDIAENSRLLAERCVTFPVVCKPTVAHGSKMAHEMILISNVRGLNVCRPPCVVQTFVNHNAVLYKIFVVGNRYFIRKRPSLKNFYPSENTEPIYYNTGDVCKVDSQSTLSILDPEDTPQANIEISEDKIRLIIQVLKQEIGLLLFGCDVVIDIITGNHAIIDINVFPGYDNFPNFLEHFAHCIDEVVMGRSNKFPDICDNGFRNGVDCSLLNVEDMVNPSL